MFFLGTIVQSTNFVRYLGKIIKKAVIKHYSSHVAVHGFKVSAVTLVYANMAICYLLV